MGKTINSLEKPLKVKNRKESRPIIERQVSLFLSVYDEEWPHIKPWVTEYAPNLVKHQEDIRARVSQIPSWESRLKTDLSDFWLFAIPDNYNLANTDPTVKVFVNAILHVLDTPL